MAAASARAQRPRQAERVTAGFEASVVIVSHNSLPVLGPCLAALAAQDLDGAFEIIVVDNGSSDGTPEWLERTHNTVRVVRQENLGFGAGNNRGAREASGRCLAFLNPDTVAEPSWLRELIAPLRPGVATTSQIVLLDDPARVNTWGHRSHFTGFGFTVGHKAARDASTALRPVGGLSGAAFAMLRADYLRVGGFDEDFFLYLEDTELSWRLRREGFDLQLAPASVARHDYVLRISPVKLGYLETGRFLLLRKHLRGWAWLVLLPSLLAAEALAWTWAIGIGWSGMKAKLGAYRRGFRGAIARPKRLPRLRLSDVAQRRVPFEEVTDNRIVRWLGHLANALFWLNSIGWRHKPRPIAR